jgi:hypothetical protein
MSETLPAIPLQYQSPIRRPRRRWLSLGRWAVLIAWPMCLLAWFLLFVEVETVLVTGPVILLLGLVAIIGGIVHRSWWLVVIGVWHVTLCLLFVALVNLRHWSPDDSRDPFIIMGLVHLILTLSLTLYVLWSPATEAVDLQRPPPHNLSPNLRLLYEFELSLGNVVARIDRNLWSSCPLAIVFRDRLHMREAIERLTLAPGVARWENRDTHDGLDAGWRCATTGHALFGPMAAPRG